MEKKLLKKRRGISGSKLSFMTNFEKRFDEKFHDLWFVATDGRNDIRCKVLKDFILAEKQLSRQEVVREIKRDIVEIIEKSQTMFFVKDENEEISPNEVMEEMKQQTILDVEMYFCELTQ